MDFYRVGSLGIGYQSRHDTSQLEQEEKTNKQIAISVQ